MPKALRKKGFTLTEMLIVIGIIVVLAGIAIVGLGRARASARMALCANNQRVIYNAVINFANDHDRFLPCPVMADEASGMLGPRLKMAKTNLCWPLISSGHPDFDNGALWSYIAGDKSQREKALRCPSDSEEDEIHTTSYSFNAMIRLGPIGDYDTLRLNEIRNAGMKVMVYEEAYPNDALCIGGLPVPTYLNSNSNSQPEPISGRHGLSNAATPGDPNKRENELAWKAGGKSHQLFFDGHSELVSVEDHLTKSQSTDSSINTFTPLR